MPLTMDRNGVACFRNCTRQNPYSRVPLRPQRAKFVPRAYLTPTSKGGQTGPLELYSSIKLCPKDATARLNQTVRRFYYEVWNNATLDIIEDLFTEDIVYKDMMFNYDDFVGVRRLRNVIAHYLKAYPDLRYSLADVAVDTDKGLAMVHWQARGSCLRNVPGMPATGRINHVSGMAKFQMAPDGRIRRVHCFRQPFHEELHALTEATPDDDFL